MSCHLQTHDKFHELLVQDPSISHFIQDSSFDALWFWNPHKPSERWHSDSFWKLLGYDPEIITGHPTCDEVIYPGDLIATVQQAHLHLENNRHPYDIVLRFYAQDDSVVWLRSRGKAIHNRDNQAIGLFGTYEDVTHLNQPLEGLLANESLGGLLLSHEDVYVITILREGTYSYVSPSFCEDLGLDCQDIIGQSSLLVVIPEDQSKCAEAAAFCFSNPHQPFHTTLRKRFKDGTIYVTQWEFIGLFDTSRQVGKILGIGTNITRRVNVAARQQYLTNLLNTTQAIANIGGWEVDLLTEQVTWTDQVYKIHEVEADFEPTLDNGFGFYHPDDRKAIETTFAQSIQTREPFDIVCRIITAKNNLRWARSSGRPTVHKGQVTRMTGVFQDITQQMKTEQDLRNALDEKIVLLNEIHHRVKNNLQVVASLLNLQARQLTDSAAKQALQSSQRRVLAMASVHKALYENESLSKIHVDTYLQELIHNIIKGMGISRIKVICEFQEVVLTIEDAIPCALIVNELITNACKHAFPDRIKNPALTIRLSYLNDEVYLAVSDNGIGIPAEYTVNSLNESASLGMTIIDALTTQLGGILDIQRLEEGGTAVTVYFSPSKQVRV